MDRKPGSSRVICSTRQPGIGQSLFMLRSMGSDASPSKPQPRPAQSTQTAGEPSGLSRPFGGAQGQRGAATSWSAAPLSIFRAAPIANWQQEAGLPKTAFASNGITALGLIPFPKRGGRANPLEKPKPILD